jgi:hypothetical protein
MLVHEGADQISCSDNDDSSGTDDLTIVEVTGSECSDNESDDVQFAPAPGASIASCATFTWEDMTNTTNRKEGQANKGVCSVIKQ